LKGAISRMTMGRAGRVGQQLLVATQVALALALLVASALLTQSFWRLRKADLGFDPRGVLTLGVPLPVRQYLTYHQNAHFFYRLLERIRALPGVVDAEATQEGMPLTAVPSFSTEALVAEGSPPNTRGATTAATIAMATPGYFKAMRIPLAAGRTFQPGDLLGEAHGVIVSAALAEKLFQDRNPVGQRVRPVSRTAHHWYTIVGVAGNVPGETVMDGPASTLYFPVLEDFAGNPQAEAPIWAYPRELVLVVRTTLPPTSLVPSVRRILHEMDPKVPIAHVSTLEQKVATAMARTRLTMLLLLVAAGTSLLLGVVGLYGIVAYAVSQRVPEFGIRLALGATPMRVSRLALSQGVRVALAGIIVGLFAAFAITRLLRGLLYQVSPGDPIAFIAMPALLLAITLVASYLPARRAGRIDPARALRAE
jgi:predicted permease